ncbi:MAG: thiamine-phosphate kinase [Alphaproteobacteria bacterium]|nr:thiamine-phosphate kinase [Alphaproteobacteria bacterium]
MHEFELIHRYFAPLAAGFPGGLNLTDDAAILDIPAGQQLIVTKDAMNWGIHFIGNEEPALIARKLLRTNLSDLAAMGAEPLCYFLSLSLPRADGDWLASFAFGLASDQKEFGLHLAGGDTTSSENDLTLSITAMGLAPRGAALRRSGARPGDGIYVSGTLGDSALGLPLISSPSQGEDKGGGYTSNPYNHSNPHPVPLPEREREFLISRYLLPQPRLELGMKLRGIATSCMDISDGLVQDLGHICKASGVGAVIHAAALPLSDAARKQPGHLEAALSGGDDYELLFTSQHEVSALELPCSVMRIGEITAAGGVVVLDKDGSEMALDKKGFSHF